MVSRKPNDMSAGVNLPFTALRQLAPPVRLMSAALWKVMKQRDVAQYGVLAEFVESTCDTVPGLLTLRHQAKLALGLRARLILELLRVPQPDTSIIGTQLKKISAPSRPSTSSAPTAKTDVKVNTSVKSFHTLVHELLTDQVAKEEFFQEEFFEGYGPLFDQSMEKLLWEFLVRLDQLLPVPSLSQTVSWLSETPAVLEECAHAASQQQLLKILLDHEAGLGHLDAAAPLPPNMGDSILTSLSLPLSGKVPSNRQRGPGSSSSGDQATQKKDETLSVAPAVCRLIADNDDVPAMKRSKQDGDVLTNWKARSSRANRNQEGSDKETVTSQMHCPSMAACLRHQPRVVIRKLQPSELCRGVSCCRKASLSPSLSDSTLTSLSLPLSGKVPSNRQQGLGSSSSSDQTAQRKDELLSVAPAVCRLIPDNDDVPAMKRSKQDGGVLTNLKAWNGNRNQEGSDEGTVTSQKYCPSMAACLRRQPRVVIRKLQRSELCRRGASSDGLRMNDDKENHPTEVSGGALSSPLRWSSAEALDPSGDDYVADSEDEATERLFMKRYSKTKHGTYFPTLREFLKLGTAPCHVMANDKNDFDRVK
ncbi:TERF1-interacting nuclear factor 2 [Hippocampus comes]|uniref:TERF1 (TRF1)-interacting nuclear factor 2 n=1 Tax=Hippocampus comes TaxID=109280 RepID=A0A3Q2YVD1_HIPCM|nr:PREDICTED: TERF1-interacting nuclear factor 2 [Hippocampus comes]